MKDSFSNLLNLLNWVLNEVYALCFICPQNCNYKSGLLAGILQIYQVLSKVSEVFAFLLLVKLSGVLYLCWTGNCSLVPKKQGTWEQNEIHPLHIPVYTFRLHIPVENFRTFWWGLGGRPIKIFGKK